MPGDAALLANAETTPANDSDLAYSLGASLGERLRQEMPDLQLDALLEGLRQAYQGEPPRIAKSRMQAILEQHETQANAAAEKAQVDKLVEAEKRFIAGERAKTGVRELPEGLLYSELASGSGAQPKPGGRVQVKYVGKLPDGTVFDQNLQPQWFKLDSVIEGGRWRCHG